MKTTKFYAKTDLFPGGGWYLKGIGSRKTLETCPKRTLTRYMAQHAETVTHHQEHTLDSILFWRFLTFHKLFDRWKGGVVNHSSLAFYPYPERLNLTSYAFWESIWRGKGPAVRVGLESESEKIYILMWSSWILSSTLFTSLSSSLKCRDVLIIS